jgi:hypothetical protein
MENESNKTAIDQMFDIIEGLAEYSPENPMLQSLLAAKPRLKEMEKEQQKYFFDCGRQYQLTGEGTFNQVHNETYGGNK